MTFAERLKELREDHGLHQYDVAEICGIATASYSNWEQGRVQPPINQLPVLAETFDVSTDYLLGVSKNQYGERIANRIHCLPEKVKDTILKLIFILENKGK